MGVVTVLLPIVLPVFLAAGVGFAWGKSKQPYEVNFVTNLVTSVGTPCLMFGALVKAEIELSAMVEMGVGTIACLGIMMAIGYGGLRAIGRDVRSYLPAMMFANGGNMGLPICLFAFGDDGLALALAYFAVSAILQLTVGLMIASGGMSLKDLVQTPLIYAVLAAVAVHFFDLSVPQWILNTVDLIGGLTIPMMLLTLGVSLSRMKVSKIPISMVLAFSRLLLATLIAVFVSWALGFEGLSHKVLILQFSMPIAVFNYLFAQRFDTDPEGVAGAVLVSTAFSLLSLSVLLTWLL